MPASSSARATPQAATQAPLPPDSTSPTFLFRSDGIGRDLEGREDLRLRLVAGGRRAAAAAARGAPCGRRRGRTPSAARASATSFRRASCTFMLKGSSVSRGVGIGGDARLGYAAPWRWTPAAPPRRPPDAARGPARARAGDRRGHARRAAGRPSTTSTRAARCCCPEPFRGARRAGRGRGAAAGRGGGRRARRWAPIPIACSAIGPPRTAS